MLLRQLSSISRISGRRFGSSHASVRGADGVVIPVEGQSDYLVKRAATSTHAHESSELWRKISLYVAIPGCLLGAIWTYKCEAAHEAHLEHIKEENGGEEPEKVKYPYIGKLEKAFPWGEKPLFNTLLGKD